MQYSPKLKRVIAQISKIMKDADVAGVCVLRTPGHSEYIMEGTPSYSCAEWMPLKDGLTIKGKLIHYNGDKVKRDEKLTNTINMLSLLA